MTERTRKGQQGRRLPAAKIAAAVAHAQLHGNRSAAKRHGVAERTIESYRSQLRRGELPEVAQLVDRFTEEAARKHADLLGDTLEKTLKRIQKLLPEATISECAKVAETLGDLRIQRDYFGTGDDDAGSSTRRKDQTPRTATGRDGGAPGASSDGPVH